MRPDAPLRSRIGDAQAKLGARVKRLDAIHASLSEKNRRLFGRIVAANRAGNTPLARGLAHELAEAQKIERMVRDARLAMEQVQIRLNTVSELGDVVVTLSPAMSVIKGLGDSIGGVMPEANASMQDLSKVLGEVLSGSSVADGGLLQQGAGESAESAAIMAEAHAVIEGDAGASIPDVPDSLKHDVVQRRQTYA